MIKTLMKNIFTPLLTRIKALEYSMGLIADYVVEYGTSGIWTYKKWASGDAECWGTKTASFTQTNAFGYSYLSPLQSAIDYPFTFTEKQFVNVTVAKVNSYTIISGDDNPLTKTPTFYACCTTQVTSSRTADVYFEAHGKWK